MISKLFSPVWTALICAIIAVVTLGAVYVQGKKAGYDSCKAEQEKTRQAVEAALEKSRQATADAISAIKVEHTTVTQKVQREIIKEPVYRDCLHTDAGMRSVNEALTGVTGSAGAGQLPGTNAAR